jgi:hypothetical protein
MKNLPSTLGWLGLAFVLLPIALICLALMIAIVIASPMAGLVFGFIVFAVGRAIFGSKKP